MTQYFHLTSIFTANLSLSLPTVRVSLFSDFPLSSLACTLPPLHSFVRPPPGLAISDVLWSGLDWFCCLLLSHLSGGFSETYAALCDYNGIGCKEEVQWVRTLYRSTSVCFFVFFCFCLLYNWVGKQNSFFMLLSHISLTPCLLLLVSFFLISSSLSLLLCSRMLTPSTTLRTTGSSIYWTSAILTAGDTVYWHLNPKPRLITARQHAFPNWKDTINLCQASTAAVYSAVRVCAHWLCTPSTFDFKRKRWKWEWSADFRR